MNKAWITGLTLAGVAGSAGAAYAGISSADQHTPSVEAQGLPAATTPSTTAPAHSYTYQVGDAGTVGLTLDDGVITVDSALAGALPWTVGTYSAPAAHVEVSFTNGMQQVTFIADVVNGDIVVSLTNVPVPGATTAPAPLTITDITNSPAPTTSAAPAPKPAVPAAQAPMFVPVPAPSGSHTTSPSWTGTSHSDDDSFDDSHSDDSHESHSDDSHESEGGSDD